MKALAGLTLAVIVALCVGVVMTARGQQPLVARDGPITLTLLRGVPCDDKEILANTLPQYRKDFSKGSMVAPDGVKSLCWDEEQTRLSPEDQHYVVVIGRQVLPVPKRLFGQPI